mmetsp:Transcript_657/g.845  ORF Transcript_657/g.845 Transcript_657/m.845 type:complete len:98 (-) Transcript_657:361-654(-)
MQKNVLLLRINSFFNNHFIAVHELYKMVDSTTAFDIDASDISLVLSTGGAKLFRQPSIHIQDFCVQNPLKSKFNTKKKQSFFHDIPRRKTIHPEPQY